MALLQRICCCCLAVNRQGFFVGGKHMEQANLTSILMDEKDMQRALKRISHQIVESQHGCDGLVLMGIYRRGVPLAQRIAEYIEQNEGVQVPVGKLDITRHRDDLDTVQHLAESISRSEVPCDLTGAHVVLVDDVFTTGATARACATQLKKLPGVKEVVVLSLVRIGT
jgi:pyrimidine operon attenuation protein/uracil phosphoribosyltransferase